MFTDSIGYCVFETPYDEDECWRWLQRNVPKAAKGLGSYKGVQSTCFVVPADYMSHSVWTWIKGNVHTQGEESVLWVTPPVKEGEHRCAFLEYVDTGLLDCLGMFVQTSEQVIERRGIDNWTLDPRTWKYWICSQGIYNV